MGSDDGYLYCLELKTGKLLWKKRGGPSNEKVLGNDFVVSRWPIRGGAAVRENVVYFGAGVWPIDRAYLHAVDAETGKEQWRTVTGGSMPDKKEGHGFAPQGYLAVGAEKFIATACHTAPAVFDTAGGALLDVVPGKHYGASIVDSRILYLDGIYELANPRTQVCSGLETKTVVASPEWIFWLGGRGGSVVGVKRDGPIMKEKSARKDPAVVWSTRSGGTGYALIGAGPRLYAGGAGNKGKGFVSAISIETKKTEWKAGVEGSAYGLAAGDGRLIASTTKGFIYCFAGGDAGKAQAISPKRGDAAGDAAWEKIAGEIVRQAGFSEGYCVDLGCGDGRLALALARRSKLYVVAVEKDEKKVKEARLRLDLAGVYGKRVMVIHADPADSGLPKWFANLVVSGRSVEGGKGVVARTEAGRIQRPYGGVTVFGKAGAMQKNVRGPLKGAGNWTHYLADAANTDCSDDTALKAPLRTHWYRDTHTTIPHCIAGAPLFVAGRLYVMYGGGVQAVDPYNGRPLWKHPLKDMMPTWPKAWHTRREMRAGYMCADEKSVYVRLGSRIERLDGLTGEVKKVYEAPEKTDRTTNVWTYVAYDNGMLYAMVASNFAVTDKRKVITHPEAGAIKALDPKTGDVKWTYTAKISIPNPSIAGGGGRVYFVDRPFTGGSTGNANYATIRAAGPGEVVALDAKTGAVVWKQAVEQLRPVLAYSAKHDVLIRTAAGNNKRWSVARGAPLVAMRGSDGKVLWGKKGAPIQAYPIIVGGTLYLQPCAWDLLTGEKKMDPRTGKPWAYERKSGKACGEVSASRNIIAFGGRDLAYVNLNDYRQTEFCGGIRPGCQINAIPAGGLLLMPDASPCGCAFNKAWIALQGE